MSDFTSYQPSVKSFKSKLFKAGVSAFVICSLLYLIQMTRIYPVESLLRLDLLFVSVVALVAFYVTITVLEFLAHRATFERATLYRLSLAVSGLSLFLYLLKATVSFPVSFVLQSDLLGVVAIGVVTVTLSVSIRSHELSSEWETAIQATFVLSLVALAYTNTPPSYVGNTFVTEASENFYVLAVSTGILTFLSVSSTEVRPTFFGSSEESVVRDPRMRRYVVGTFFSLIVVYFVLLRWPFLSETLGSAPHGDKYASHVPYLQEMYRAGNPFYYSNPAYTTIFFNYYVPEEFSRAPIFSWTALPFMTFVDRTGIEPIVRGVLTAQGAFLLGLLFLLLRDVFDGEIALYGVVLFAVNPVFNLVSYITVTDLPALAFTFASLLAYLYDRKTYSYLLCGMAVVAKNSFLLISVPAVLVLVFTDEEAEFYNALKLSALAFAPLLCYSVLVKPAAGSSVLVGTLRTVAFGASLLVVARTFERYDDTFEGVTARVDERVQYAILGVTPLLGVAFLWDKIVRYAPGFLTDRFLLLNVGMYSDILEMVRELQPDAVFQLSLLGLAWILIWGTRKKKRVTLALAGATVSYTVLASKAIYFHAYYKHVLVFVCIFFFLGVLDALQRTRLSAGTTSLLTAVLVSLLVISSQAAWVGMLERDVYGTREMGEYIDGEVPDSEKVVYTEPAGSLLTIYSNASFMYTPDAEIQVTALRSEIGAKGFGAALHGRNITYYLSHGEGDFSAFKYLLADDTRMTSRTDIILAETGSDEQIDSRYDGISSPKEHFSLEAKIGDWYLYRITTEQSPPDAPARNERDDRTKQPRNRSASVLSRPVKA